MNNRASVGIRPLGLNESLAQGWTTRKKHHARQLGPAAAITSCQALKNEADASGPSEDVLPLRRCSQRKLSASNQIPISLNLRFDAVLLDHILRVIDAKNGRVEIVAANWPEADSDA
jgi:hypothetical protein